MKEKKTKVYKSGSLKNGIIEVVISVIILVLTILLVIGYRFNNIGLIALYILLVVVFGFMMGLGLYDIHNGRIKKVLLKYGVKDVGKLLYKTRVSGLKKSNIYRYQYRYQNQDYIMEEQIDPKLYDHYNEGKNIPILVYDRRAIIDYEKIFGKNYYKK